MEYIKPFTKSEYDNITKQRAIEGLGPFCGSYEKYLKFVEANNKCIDLKIEQSKSKE